MSFLKNTDCICQKKAGYPNFPAYLLWISSDFRQVADNYMKTVIGYDWFAESIQYF